MNIKPIKTEKDYLEALKQIDKPRNAKPNTPGSDKLEVLVTLVEAHEHKHYPITPPDPIEAIKELMKEESKPKRKIRY